MKSITKALIQVQKRITEAVTSAHRNASTVHLLAVSKTKPESAIREAYAAGQTSFGENYLQDAIPKIKALQDLKIEWHYIGQIQSNKTKEIAENFDWVHGISSIKHAQHLNKHRSTEQSTLQCCIQVNLSAESSKSGIQANKLTELVSSIESLPQLKLRGLMTMPNPNTPESEQKAIFHSLAQLLQQLNASDHELDTLSMGMSNDLEIAISEGATMVRIGTDIFGKRDYPE